MAIMEKIAEVNTQLAELRLQIKQRDERIAGLENILYRIIIDSRENILSIQTIDEAQDLLITRVRLCALLDPTT